MAKRKLVDRYYLKRPNDDGVVFLNIYENKKGLRGTVADKRNVRLKSEMFYSRDNADTIGMVMGYYGFTKDNSIKIK